MIKELTLPEGGMGITEGTILQWRKAEGDEIAAGEVLVEVETAKAVTEVPSPVDGVLEKIVAGPGATVEVNAVIALVREKARR